MRRRYKTDAANAESAGIGQARYAKTLGTCLFSLQSLVLDWYSRARVWGFPDFVPTIATAEAGVASINL